MPKAPLSAGPRRLGRRLRVVRRRLRRFWGAAEFTLARRFGLATRDDRIFLVLIVAVGLLAGVLGIVVHRLIDAWQVLLWRSSGSFIEAALRLPPWQRVAVPVVGGLAVGLVVLLTRREVGGQGMSVLIESVAVSGGRVPGRPVISRAVAAIATVGSGGSLGREGPMIRLGSMIASRSAIRLGLSPHRVKVLVGCGAAAGLAAAYNIPIGGALFAMEVILGNFALEIFGPIVVSSVISTLVARSVEGSSPIYQTPHYTLESLWEVPAYLGLGVLGALVSLLFIFSVRAGNRGFDRLTFLPQAAKPVVGMALVGLLSLALPRVLGGGYDTINEALEIDLAGSTELTWKFLLVLAVAKLAATALTAGSGCAGGLFTPGLFFGAAVGGIYGWGVNALAPPGLVSPPGAYVAVGMAAIAAGTSHAPISAILILFEFTGNYELILPLMLAAITASLLARALYPASTYTHSLRRKGLDLSWRMEEAVLAGLKVEDLARADAQVLAPADPYPSVVELFLHTHRQRLFVVDADRRLLGAVSLHDIKHLLERPETLTAVVAHDLMVPVDRTLAAEDRLHHAAEAFARADNERLPVVDGEKRLVGVLAKRDLLAVYAQEVLGRPALLATFVHGEKEGASRDYVELPPDFAVRMVPVPVVLVGKDLATARLPQRTGGVRVIEIKREGAEGAERVIPDRDTVLRREDLLIVLGPAAEVEALGRGELRDDESLAHWGID